MSCKDDQYCNGMTLKVQDMSLKITTTCLFLFDQYVFWPTSVSRKDEHYSKLGIKLKNRTPSHEVTPTDMVVHMIVKRSVFT